MKIHLHAVLFLQMFSVFSYGTVSEANFMKDWKLFLDQQTSDLNQGDLEYEFSLLQDFTANQSSRQRELIKGIDRYKRWVPYSDNQITLKDGTEMSASLIHIGEKYHNFIATQAPMENNVHLLWQMVWEKGIDQIVMTTELIQEDGEELCVPYWPQKIGERLICENGIEVTLLEEKWLLPELKENIQTRKFNVHCNDQDRLVTHYWYHNWPDDAAPDGFKSVFTIIEAVTKDKGTGAPILAHCAAGVGRTGVFITLYHMTQRAKKGDRSIPLLDFVASLRWQRPEMVRKLSQYEFCTRGISLISN